MDMTAGSRPGARAATDHRQPQGPACPRLGPLRAHRRCFDAEIKVTRDGTTVNGNSIMGLMMLGAGPGSTILVQATGKQAREALDAITDAGQQRL